MGRIMSLVSRGSSTQSRSTRPGTRPFNPVHCSGTREYDVSMRSILSWPLGQHGSLLGYPSTFNPYTADLVGKLTGAMRSGRASIGSYAPECEERLAKMLGDRYSNYIACHALDRPHVRFFSNGTDSTQAAVALARHATYRTPIISVGYHGGSSPVFGFPPQNKGLHPANWDAVFDVEFEKYSSWRFALRSFGDQVAALIVEVPPVRNESKALATLKHMELDCATYGIKFILDEVVTGFRYSRSGALGYYSKMNPTGYAITADYVCLGKALSTYGKVSALLGPHDDMDALGSDVFASYTYNDHPLGLLDALWTLDKYDELSSLKGDQNLYSHINAIGTRLKDGLNETFRRRGFDVQCYGHPSRTTLDNDMPQDIYWEFLSKLVDEHDILLHRPQFSTMAHTSEDVERTISAVDKTLASMKYEAE